jgi:hypothetical protein
VDCARRHTAPAKTPIGSDHHWIGNLRGTPIVAEIHLTAGENLLSVQGRGSRNGVSSSVLHPDARLRAVETGQHQPSDERARQGQNPSYAGRSVAAPSGSRRSRLRTRSRESCDGSETPPSTAITRRPGRGAKAAALGRRWARGRHTRSHGPCRNRASSDEQNSRDSLSGFSSPAHPRFRYTPEAGGMLSRAEVALA